MIFSGLYLVYRYNPENSWWMPKCPFHAFTGLECPSCGNTRALHAVLHGRLTDALAYNAMAPVLVGLFVAIAWLSLVRRLSMDSRLLRLLVMAYIIVYIGWWIIRNLLAI